LVVNVIW